MIEKQIHSEWGDYTQKYNHGYEVHSYVCCIDAYKETDWQECPCCELKPMVWRFDNGLSTACGCWDSIYDHFSVCSESIMSVHIRTDGKWMDQYKSKQLKLSWDEYCATMINPCSHGDLRFEGKW